MTDFTATDARNLLQKTGGEPEIWLLTISSDELGTPFRLVRNTEDVTSRGLLFQKAWFDVGEPDDGEDEPQVRLSVPNIDREAGLAVMETSSEIKVVLELVWPSDYDRVVQAYRGLAARSIDIGKMTVDAVLTVVNHDTEPCFNLRIGPRDFPGLYR